jgi:probable phosphoglycerate mutase
MKTKLWRTVQLVPSQATFPGGESLLDLQRRGIESVEAIRRSHKRGIVAAVSHADMIKAIVAHYLGMHMDLFQRIHVETASVTAIGFFGPFARTMSL